MTECEASHKMENTLACDSVSEPPAKKQRSEHKEAGAIACFASDCWAPTVDTRKYCAECSATVDAIRCQAKDNDAKKDFEIKLEDPEEAYEIIELYKFRQNLPTESNRPPPKPEPVARQLVAQGSIDSDASTLIMSAPHSPAT